MTTQYTICERLHPRIFLALTDAGEQVILKEQEYPPGTKSARESKRSLEHEYTMHIQVSTKDEPHPYICQAHEIIEGQTLYIAMQYLQGQTLKELTKTRQPEETLVRALANAAEALLHVHDKGIIHLDVKKENIMANGTLIDFGSAREKNGHTKLDPSFTPETAAPEYVFSDLKTEFADIFSLGVTAYETLTGETPFKMRTEFELDYSNRTCHPETLQRLGALGNILIASMNPAMTHRPPLDELVSALKARLATYHPQPSANSSKLVPALS